MFELGLATNQDVGAFVENSKCNKMHILVPKLNFTIRTFTRDFNKPGYQICARKKIF